MAGPKRTISLFSKDQGLYLAVMLALALGLYACTPQQPLPPDSSLPKLELKLSHAAWEKIKQKRTEAMARGFLESSGSDYVNAELSFGGESLPAEVRLKGDWLDHLKGDKWSWRVKLEEKAILGADQFSLQSPHTRYFLHEWLFHQLLEQEGILTPRYEFVELWVNDDYKGIYAFEAHFTESILARQEQPAGVILKFNEDGFWQTQNYRMRYGENVTPALPDFEAATIEPFQKNRLTKDSLLLHAFQAARQKLELLRLANSADDLDQLIDLDYWARFFAIIDLTEAYHALRWHNMRFYYHPQTTYLYPIGFDGYAANGIYRWFRKPFLGKSRPKGNQVFFLEEHFLFVLFNNASFTEKYRQYLLQYTDTDYVASISTHFSSVMDSLGKTIAHEFPDYQYQLEELQQRGEALRDSVLAYDFQSAAPFTYTIYDPMFAECPTPVPLPAIGVKVFRQPQGDQVILSNYYCQEVTLEATGPKRNKPLHELEQKRKIPAFDIHQNPPVATELGILAEDDYIFYSVEGVDYWFKEKINPWPQGSLSQLDTRSLKIDTTVFQVNGREITPRNKLDTLYTVQVLPSDYELQIPAGTHLVLDQGAAILVYGNAQLMGKPDRPIRLTSSDRTGRGIHFLRAERVQVQHMEYGQMRTFRDRGLLLNGSMTCFTKEVDLNHVQFRGIKAEDALNVIHCENAGLQNLTFSDCSGDGLDVDFSTGTLVNGTFNSIGGDGLDLSSSSFILGEIDLNAITDKGISIGEGSQVEASGGVIQNAFIGVAAKDGSELILDNFRIEDCEYGLTVFSKKAFFGPCSVTTTTLEIAPDIQYALTLEKKHQLQVDERTQNPTHQHGALKAIFYPVED